MSCDRSAEIRSHKRPQLGHAKLSRILETTPPISEEIDGLNLNSSAETKINSATPYFTCMSSIVENHDTHS